MVAITTTATIPSRSAAPALRLVPTPGARPERLAGVVGLTVLVLAVVAAVAFLVQSGPSDTATLTEPGIGLLETTHVVADGETMWSIATEVAPAGEAATYVERLVAVNGGATVTPGQVLALPRP